MKQVFQTIDGKIFDLEIQAKNHEDQLYADWLSTNPVISLPELLEVLDDQEFVGSTARRIFDRYFRKYWETSYAQISQQKATDHDCH